MKLITLLCVFLPFAAFAQSQGAPILRSSAAEIVKNPSEFKTELCFNDESGKLPLVKTTMTVGVVHASPSPSGTRFYRFETLKETGREKTFTANPDEKGCIQILDHVNFGSYENRPENPEEVTYRGRIVGAHDRIAERVYGLQTEDQNQLILVHIIFNEGIKVGRVDLEVLK